MRPLIQLLTSGTRSANGANGSPAGGKAPVGAPSAAGGAAGPAEGASVGAAGGALSPGPTNDTICQLYLKMWYKTHSRGRSKAYLQYRPIQERQ